MRGRTPAVALTLVLTALLAGACSSSPTTSGAPTTTSTTSHRPTTTTTAAGNAAVGTWSGAVKVAPGTILTAVSCPSAQSCLMGSSKGLTYRLGYTEVSALGPAVPSPAPAGVSYLSCATISFCAAAPSMNQVALYNGTSWGAPTTIPAAQGFTAVDCTGPSFCITIDGEGNSFALRGGSWSGNLGAWGAANQISCVSPTFCVAAEGGPSVWDGSQWTQPGDADSGGQLNAVSCATTTFCVLVDSSGAVLTWNGTAFSAPQTITSEPAGHRHQRGGPHRGVLPDDHVLPGRGLGRARLRLERVGLESRRHDRPRPRADRHLLPDDDLLRRRGPGRQRLHLELTRHQAPSSGASPRPMTQARSCAGSARRLKAGNSRANHSSTSGAGNGTAPQPRSP